MENKHLKQRIEIRDIESLNQLKQEIANGSRFITYQYTISYFFAVTQRRYSPAYLLKKHEQNAPEKSRYDTLSLLFGWWSLPWGPIEAFKSFAVNKKGGIDVTEDIMLNITEKSFKDRSVVMIKTNNLFCKPDKWDLKSFNKALLREYERDENVKQITIGYFINTKEDEKPYYTLGLIIKGDTAIYTEKILQSLYKEFHSYAHFEFIDLDEPAEINEFLIRQGITIIKK